MKQVLLTGASGFIGRHAISSLVNRNFNVHCVYHTIKPDILTDETNVRWYKADILNKKDISDLFNRISPTHLLHLAWDVTPGGILNRSIIFPGSSPV